MNKPNVGGQKENRQSTNWQMSSHNADTFQVRKLSAKQHYLAVARYVAGQSTNISRYVLCMYMNINTVGLED